MDAKGLNVAPYLLPEGPAVYGFMSCDPPYEMISVVKAAPVR